MKKNNRNTEKEYKELSNEVLLAYKSEVWGNFYMFLSDSKNISVFWKCEVDRRTEILFEVGLEGFENAHPKE